MKNLSFPSIKIRDRDLPSDYSFSGKSTSRCFPLIKKYEPAPPKFCASGIFRNTLWIKIRVRTIVILVGANRVSPLEIRERQVYAACN